MNAKLHDVVGRPGGVGRLVAHRCTGVASADIRKAEVRLETVLLEVSTAAPTGPGRPGRGGRPRKAA